VGTEIGKDFELNFIMCVEKKFTQTQFFFHAHSKNVEQALKVQGTWPTTVKNWQTN
jgi:hypothetical protein